MSHNISEQEAVDLLANNHAITSEDVKEILEMADNGYNFRKDKLDPKFNNQDIFKLIMDYYELDKNPEYWQLAFETQVLGEGWGLMSDRLQEVINANGTVEVNHIKTVGNNWIQHRYEAKAANADDQVITVAQSYQSKKAALDALNASLDYSFAIQGE